jgi:hypothetical protein
LTDSAQRRLKETTTTMPTTRRSTRPTPLSVEDNSHQQSRDKENTPSKNSSSATTSAAQHCPTTHHGQGASMKHKDGTGMLMENTAMVTRHEQTQKKRGRYDFPIFCNFSLVYIFV